MKNNFQHSVGRSHRVKGGVRGKLLDNASGGHSLCLLGCNSFPIRFQAQKEEIRGLKEEKERNANLEVKRVEEMTIRFQEDFEALLKEEREEFEVSSTTERLSQYKHWQVCGFPLPVISEYCSSCYQCFCSI